MLAIRRFILLCLLVVSFLFLFYVRINGYFYQTNNFFLRFAVLFRECALE